MPRYFPYAMPWDVPPPRYMPPPPIQGLDIARFLINPQVYEQALAGVSAPPNWLDQSALGMPRGGPPSGAPPPTLGAALARQAMPGGAQAAPGGAQVRPTPPTIPASAVPADTGGWRPDAAVLAGFPPGQEHLAYLGLGGYRQTMDALRQGWLSAEDKSVGEQHTTFEGS